MIQSGKEQRLLKNTLFIYLMRIATYIFPLITTPYLTRVLTENNYGIYTWVSSIINYARLAVDFGFVIYGVEAVARCGDDKKAIGLVIGIIIKFKIVFCGITAGVLGILCVRIDEFHKYALIIAIAYLPAIVSIFAIDYAFQGMELMKYITVRTVITKGIFTGLVFICIRKSEQYMLVPVFTAIGDTIAIVMMWTMLYKMGIHVVRTRLSIGWDLFKKSAWYFISRISGAAYTYGNTILLGIFVTKGDVAQFSVGYTLVTVAQNLITPLSDSLYPYMIKNQDYKMVRKLLLIFEPLIILACIAGFFLAKPVVTWWFGTEYEEAASVLCCMIPIILVALPGCLCGYPVLSSLGLYKEVNIAIVIAAVFHLVGWGILILTGLVSIYTVAFLTCITEGMTMVIRVGFVMKEKKRRRKMFAESQ